VVLAELLRDGGLVEAISGNGCEDSLCGVDVGADLVDDAVNLACCIFDEIETAGSELAKVDTEETWKASAPSQIYGIIRDLLST